MTRTVIGITSPVVPICTEAAPCQQAFRIAIKWRAHAVEPDYFVACFRSEGVDDLRVAQIFPHRHNVLNKIGNRIIAPQGSIKTASSDRRVGPQWMYLRNHCHGYSRALRGDRGTQSRD